MIPCFPSLHLHVLTLLALASGALRPPSAQGADLRILPLGDSITAGYSVAGGYRKPLFTALQKHGIRVDFLGTQKDFPDPALPDSDHEGHSGSRVDDFVGPAGYAYRTLTAQPKPDFILLMVGTNNINNDEDPKNAVRLLDTAVGEISNPKTGWSPHSELIVANIILQKNSKDQTADVAIFNKEVEEIVNRHQVAGERVHFLDLHAVLAGDDLADALHPNLSGYAKMGEAWADAILKIQKR